MIKPFAFCIMLLLITSCSVFSPRDVGKANMLDLEAYKQATHSKTKKLGAIRVVYPVAISALDTYRIAVKRMDGREDYFAGARWREFLPSVIAQSLAETFINSQYFMRVESDDIVIENGLVLETHINEFQAIYSELAGIPKVYINISFTLRHAHDKSIIKEFILESQTKAKVNSISEISAAFNQSFKDIEHQLLVRITTRK